MIHIPALDAALRRFPYLLNLHRRAVWHGEVHPFRVHLAQRLPAIRLEYRLVLREIAR
jgi:hypothetical protein